MLRTLRAFNWRKPLTEKRIHPRRRRRRGDGGILEEARRSVTFPLGGRCPRISRVGPPRRRRRQRGRVDSESYREFSLMARDAEQMTVD